MTTVQRGCRSKKAISSLRCSLRLSWTVPPASTPWSWNTDLAISRPIMVMLIVGSSLCRSRQPAPWHSDAVEGRPPHLVLRGGDRGLARGALHHAGRAVLVLALGDHHGA